MKRLALILSALLIITSSLCANNTVTKNYNFGNIKSIEASSIFTIEVTQGNAKGVRIECDDIYEKHLDIRCSQGELKLSLTPNARIERNRNEKDQIGIKVYLQMQTIGELDLSGASSLKATGVFTTNELEIDLSGATSVSGLNISGNELSLDCSGASTLELEGEFSKEIEADISGASNVKLKVDGNILDAEVSGAATLTVNGAHNNTSIACSGASKVKMDGHSKYLKSITTGASEFDGKDYAATNGYAEVSGASNAKVKCIKELKVNVSKSSKLTYYMNPTIINLNPEKSNIIKSDKDGKEISLDAIEIPLFQGQPAKRFAEWLLYQLEDKWTKNKSYNGKVLLSFIVGEDGRVRNVKLARSTGYPELDKMIIQIVNTSPKWTPKKINGVPVDHSFILPITLNGQNTLKKYNDSGHGEYHSNKRRGWN